uniref:Uncharacterized protein n=1 Tax=Arundo donax TaxID=35708 RepID=A0A0A9BEI4_ARUDO
MHKRRRLDLDSLGLRVRLSAFDCDGHTWILTPQNLI